MLNLSGLHRVNRPQNYVIHSAIFILLWILTLLPVVAQAQPTPSKVYSSTVPALAQEVEGGQKEDPAGAPGLGLKKGFSPEACATCHQAQHEQWQASHHAKAMLLPNAQSVEADFNNTQANHLSQFARFSVNNHRYTAKVWSGSEHDEASAVFYEVKYTFGVYPLQQYLVSTGNGHVHVLPFAWDTRTQQEGGQRWMHLYKEDITPQDRLHWQQPLQNWNGMCADCHSDDITRNYNPQTESFDTKWTHVSVGCGSCHDDLPSDHAKFVVGSPHAASKPKVDISSKSELNASVVGQWLRSDSARVATWQGEPRDNSFMDGCYACHALRSPLTDGFDSNKPFLDQFIPTYTNTPIYHADGQIKEEAYVYGSFKQSKMHARGVNCLDCHNSHSYELKFEGNKVCTQCHSSSVFDSTLHHGHQQNTEPAMCVTCHMPAATYMNVDARRDHSFKVPRPDVSHLYGTPNVCTSCHTDKTAQWAAKAISVHAKKDGLATTQPLSENERALFDLQTGQALEYSRHLSLVKDVTIAPIRRAGALAMFRFMPMLLNPRDAQPYINHNEPLMRLAVIDALEDQPGYIKAGLISPLLTDAYKAVRVKAAFSLAGVPLADEFLPVFNRAFDEWQTSNIQMQFRGEAHVNAALVTQKQRNQQAAIDAYIKSISVDPYFAPAYVNLSDIYRQTGQVGEEGELLASAVRLLPQSAVVHYGYGLFFVRQKQLSKAIAWLKRAHIIEKSNGQYAYMYYLALHTQGESEKAWCGLQEYISTNRQQNVVELANGIRGALSGGVDCKNLAR